MSKRATYLLFVLMWVPGLFWLWWFLMKYIDLKQFPLITPNIALIHGLYTGAQMGCLILLIMRIIWTYTFNF